MGVNSDEADGDFNMFSLGSERAGPSSLSSTSLDIASAIICYCYRFVVTN